MNQGAQQQQQKPKTAIDLVKDRLYSKNMESALKAVMPKVGTIDRFMALALQSVKLSLQNIPDLDYNSVLVGIYDSAKCGLELNPTLGEAYLLPFKVKYKGRDGLQRKKTVVVFCPGYKGLIKMTRRAGTKDVQSTVVYEKDVWEYFEDEYGPHIKYSPTYDREKGRPVCVYVRAILENGSRKVLVVPWHKIENIKKQADSRNHGTGPWSTHLEEMGEKTGLRRICKTLPQEAIAAEALGIDETITELNKMPVRSAPAELEEVLDADYTEMTDALREQEEQTGQQQPLDDPKSKSELAGTPTPAAVPQSADQPDKGSPTKSAEAAQAPTKPVVGSGSGPVQPAAAAETVASKPVDGDVAPELKLDGPAPASEEEKPGPYQVAAMHLIKELGWGSDRLKQELKKEFDVEGLIQVPIKKRPIVLQHLRDCLNNR